MYNFTIVSFCIPALYKCTDGSGESFIKMQFITQGMVLQILAKFYKMS
jgi:hypothetical protein